MRVIGTVGLPGSGKGEVATVAAEEDVPVVTMGDVIREECERRGLDPAEHHGAVAKTLREEEGPAAIADRTVPRVESAADAGADVVLVDGLRSTVELDRFRERFGDGFLLVAVDAPFEVRAERLGARGRDDSDLDAESLRDREARELEFGMADVIDAADVTVDNTDSLTAFRTRVRDLLADAADCAFDPESDDATDGTGAGTDDAPEATE
ncbi:AAA family ATPase [Candidatus Halobonum tyrrellensis]|uniref:Dephospho-CoA kinase n=1 Tax=Candidatus Halobonum tyrrellensis G22 TaxID=1324957 RepID=V4HJ84_9EURY|nr:AAA family ATPase [Candidatus Halobonum tyrrellensis]ESP87984.1 dephospho-CoA kinase [Candidatus Halobonum tyrrellensis G22]